MNIYKIEKEYIEIANRIIDNGGAMDEELEKELAINEANLQEKARNYGYVVKTINGEVDIIDIEIKRLTALKNARKNTVNRLKETIKNAMNLYQIDKVETPTLKINFRKSKSVVVENIEKLDLEFVTVKISKSADKTGIKNAIESGEDVQGATLQENFNLQIK